MTSQSATINAKSLPTSDLSYEYDALIKAGNYKAAVAVLREARNRRVHVWPPPNM